MIPTTSRSLPSRATLGGVTLVELMVGLALMAIIVTLAVPSFLGTRERAVLRGSTDQLVSFWANARFEAVKRGSRVKVSFVRSNAGAMCLGASMTATASDNTACDCFTAGSCDIARFPESQGQWSGSIWTGNSTFGDSSSGVVVIDPRTGFLSQSSDDGAVTIQSSSRTSHYRLRFAVDSQGRSGLCEPSDAPLSMPGYGSKQC